MRRRLLWLLCLGLFGCSGSSGEEGDAGSGDVAHSADVVDLAAEPEVVPEIAEEENLWPFEVDDTPGCAGDFCAAGPDHAPNPAEWGPFPVGVTTMVVKSVNHEGLPRNFRVEIWYPTTEEHRDGPFGTIDIYSDAPDPLQEYVAQFEGAVPPIEVQTTRDTPVRGGDGPYPIILFSHGAYGVRYQSVFFTIQLASHGYIVASIDHVGNTLYDIFGPQGFDMGVVVLSAMDRPYDSAVALTAVTVRNDDPDDMFFKTMDVTEIGMSGHSFGGFTSYLMPHLDKRIKAIVPMAPATAGLGILGYPLEELEIPSLMMVGMLDNTLDVEMEMFKGYEKIPPTKALLALKAGGHYTFSDICQLDLEYVASELGFIDAEDALTDGCADFNVPVATAHPIINQFAIGWFNYYLRHSPGSLKYFEQDAAKEYEEHIDYEVVFE